MVMIRELQVIRFDAFVVDGFSVSCVSEACDHHLSVSIPFCRVGCQSTNERGGGSIPVTLERVERTL
jgi:hypothetical protein